MKGVSQIAYMKGWNQLWLLNNGAVGYLTESEAFGGKRVFDVVSKYVERVDDGCGNTVRMGCFFTNIFRWNKVKEDYWSNLVVFPVRGEVSYNLRRGVSYCVEDDGDPGLISVDDSGFGFCSKGSFSLFGKNVHSGSYDCLRDCFFQTKNDIENASEEKRRIVCKAERADVGSLDFLV